MSTERRIEAEIEVPVNPEEAWEAIATGPGITGWFMPAEVDGRVGGSIVHHHEADTSSSGTVTVYDPPQRFAFEESGSDFDPEERVIATEFQVEARDGGTCSVRVVMSGFGDGDAWDQAIESFTAGWHQALVSLRLYLAHFRGQPVASVNAGAMVKGGTWDHLAGALNVPTHPAPGEPVTTGTGAPTMVGRVERAGDHMITLLLDEPARGIGLIGAGGTGEETFMTVRAQLFGQGADQVATREQRAWKSWFSELTSLIDD